jgi:hypothetical protein
MLLNLDGILTFGHRQFPQEFLDPGEAHHNRKQAKAENENAHTTRRQRMTGGPPQSPSIHSIAPERSHAAHIEPL